jgi:LysR family transcriptional activator of nhaA
MGEFADLALLRIFAEESFGAFAVPTAMEERMRRAGFHKIGGTKAITVSFYAITVERQVRHPAVAAVCETARDGMLRMDGEKRSPRRKSQRG